MPSRRLPPPDWALARRAVLSRRLATLRHERGLSQDAVAEAAGIDRRSVQRYESGARDPRFMDLLLIADALGVTLAHLVREE